MQQIGCHYFYFFDIKGGQDLTSFPNSHRFGNKQSGLEISLCDTFKVHYHFGNLIPSSTIKELLGLGVL